MRIEKTTRDGPTRVTNWDPDARGKRPGRLRGTRLTRHGGTAVGNLHSASCTSHASTCSTSAVLSPTNHESRITNHSFSTRHCCGVESTTRRGSSSRASNASRGISLFAPLTRHCCQVEPPVTTHTQQTLDVPPTRHWNRGSIGTKTRGQNRALDVN